MREILILFFLVTILSGCGARKRVQNRNIKTDMSIPKGITPEVTTVKINPIFNSTSTIYSFF